MVPLKYAKKAKIMVVKYLQLIMFSKFVLGGFEF